MLITYHHITPAPLAGVIHSQSDIWDTEVTFQEGTSYLVYAPSGKGKSTFTHIMYGLRNDFVGSATVDGQDTRKITRQTWAALRQEKMSIVFQDLRLFLHLTAWENLQVKAQLYSQVKEDDLLAMVERLGVQHVLHKQAQFLSYGERHRVAIIRSLIQPFSFLLFDDPFSHLDVTYLD